MTNQEYFIKYMREEGLSSATINKYAYDTPNNLEVQQVFVKHTGSPNMYNTTSRSKLLVIIDEIMSMEFDIVGHKMYSAGVKKYLKYLVANGLATQ